MAHIPAPDSVFIPAEKLRSFMESIFITLGLSVENARITTDVLLEADLRGIDTHGVGRLSIYVDSLRSGQQNPNAAPTVSDAPGTRSSTGEREWVRSWRHRQWNRHGKGGGDGIGGIAVRNRATSLSRLFFPYG